jgi:hypothetical protein
LFPYKYKAQTIFVLRRYTIMMKAILDARTVSIVKPYTEEKRQGSNGEFTVKEVLFKIAVDRSYKVTRTENGKQVTDYPTDFYLAKATGNTAEAFAKYCSGTKADGKLQSRRLLLVGTFETYNKARIYEKDFQVQAPTSGEQFTIRIHDELADTNVIFIVDSMSFLDSNPANRNQGQAQASATAVVGVAGAPVAQPVPVAGAPVVVQAQAPAVAQAGQAVIADMNAMNPPVVGDEFSAVGQTAPF